MALGVGPPSTHFAIHGNKTVEIAIQPGPGSAAGALIVSDIEAAHDKLVRCGIDASEMWHGPPFPPEARLSGPDPKRTSYGSFFAVKGPDRNTCLVQEVTTRLPGRV
jgi:hypothetical protein